MRSEVPFWRHRGRFVGPSWPSSLQPRRPPTTHRLSSESRHVTAALETITRRSPLSSRAAALRPDDSAIGEALAAALRKDRQTASAAASYRNLAAARCHQPDGAFHVANDCWDAKMCDAEEARHVASEHRVRNLMRRRDLVAWRADASVVEADFVFASMAAAGRRWWGYVPGALAETAWARPGMCCLHLGIAIGGGLTFGSASLISNIALDLVTRANTPGHAVPPGVVDRTTRRQSEQQSARLWAWIDAMRATLPTRTPDERTRLRRTLWKLMPLCPLFVRGTRARLAALLAALRAA